MKAAWVLPRFAGIASHALCRAHMLRELVAVIETGTALDKT